MYEKVRGHHCWWLNKDGKSIANFDINGLTSDEEAEASVDEIVNLEKYHKNMQHECKRLRIKIEQLEIDNERLENKVLFGEA